MTARKRFTERQVLAVIIAQGGIIPCYRCKEALDDAYICEREHVTPIALGGHDTVCNSVYSHSFCHKRKTFGTKATTAGSDIHAIAKVKRILKNLREKKCARDKAQDAVARFRKRYRPMKSRGFEKRHRPMRRGK